MEELWMDKGVFIDSANLGLKRMVQCLQALEAFPVSTVTSVESDDRYGGFRVALAHAEARKLLQQRYLIVSDQHAGVYPLTTYLLVHNIDVSARIERDLIDAMQKFGKVMHCEEGPPDPADNRPTHLVLLDVPEIETLTAFQKNGFPKMSVFVPSMNKIFKVTFWCRQCRESEHSYWNCRMSRAKVLQGETPKSSGWLSSPSQAQSSTDMPSGSVPGSSRDFESLERFSSKVSMKCSSGGLLDHEALKQETTNDKAKNISRIIDSLKKSKEREEYASSARAGDVDESSNWSASADKPDSSERSPVAAQNESDEDPPFPYGFVSPLSNATSTTDDEIQILSEAKGHENNPPKTEIKTEPQSNGSPERSPPATPQGNWVAQLPGPSTTLHQSQFKLSHMLEGCIDRAYEDFPILDRKTLESFLVHVKKKSTPTRVAEKYTKDVKGLENQLRRILKNYYNLPKIGTKDDSLFIKWLNGLVERFNGPVCRKRKPSTRGIGSPPPKR